MSKKKPTSDYLKFRHVAIDTYRENVAYLNSKYEVYRAEGFQALSKIEIIINSHNILAVLNVVHDTVSTRSSRPISGSLAT